MPIFQSEAARGIITPPMPVFAGAPTVWRYTMQIPATGLLVNDIFEIAAIPPNMRVADIILDTDDLDTNASPLHSMSVGIMSGQWGDTAQNRTCGAEFFSALTTGRTGGVANPTLATAYRTGKAAFARSIGVQFTALAATAAAGQIGLTVTCVD
jgi:hypothetical protein